MLTQLQALICVLGAAGQGRGQWPESSVSEAEAIPATSVRNEGAESLAEYLCGQFPGLGGGSEFCYWAWTLGVWFWGTLMSEVFSPGWEGKAVREADSAASQVGTLGPWRTQL